jgi:predicted Zn-dependent protease with MMP-like domain
MDGDHRANMVPDVKVNTCPETRGRCRPFATRMSLSPRGNGVFLSAGLGHSNRMSQNMTLARMEEIAHQTVAAFPPPFREGARAVALQVADWPAPDMLDDLGMQDPLELTGLYEGIPLTEKSVFDQPMGPDTVWLFREPILAEWRDRGDVSLKELVAHVTVHEFAHHFGWSDDDIATIDRWWE